MSAPVTPNDSPNRVLQSSRCGPRRDEPDQQTPGPCSPNGTRGHARRVDATAARHRDTPRRSQFRFLRPAQHVSRLQLEPHDGPHSPISSPATMKDRTAEHRRRRDAAPVACGTQSASRANASRSRMRIVPRPRSNTPARSPALRTRFTVWRTCRPPGPGRLGSTGSARNCTRRRQRPDVARSASRAASSTPP